MAEAVTICMVSSACRTARMDKQRQSRVAGPQLHRWCHTSVMANDPPSDAGKNDIWIDAQGELFFFDGTNWVRYVELLDARDDDEPPSILR
jgi:hypothetical protein